MVLAPIEFQNQSAGCLAALPESKTKSLFEACLSVRGTEAEAQSVQREITEHEMAQDGVGGHQAIVSKARREAMFLQIAGCIPLEEFESERVKGLCRLHSGGVPRRRTTVARRRGGMLSPTTLHCRVRAPIDRYRRWLQGGGASHMGKVRVRHCGTSA
jgi:hypothetical protein